jgi:hypothetical protein
MRKIPAGPVGHTDTPALLPSTILLRLLGEIERESERTAPPPVVRYPTGPRESARVQYSLD